MSIVGPGQTGPGEPSVGRRPTAGRLRPRGRDRPRRSLLRAGRSPLDDPMAAARAVRELTRPGDGVQFLPARRREPVMSSPGEFRGLREPALARHAVPSGTLHGIELSAPRIRARMLTAERIAAVMDPPGQPLDDTPQERTKREVLAQHVRRCAEREVRGMVVVPYARPGAR